MNGTLLAACMQYAASLSQLWHCVANKRLSQAQLSDGCPLCCHDWHDAVWDVLVVTLQGAQLLEMLKLLPAAATEQRVELCSRFWARLIDRAKTWSDVMRALTSEQQVRSANAVQSDAVSCKALGAPACGIGRDSSLLAACV